MSDMAYIMVDVETDGPIPGDYSMISFGAVLVDEQLNKTFYGQLKPSLNNIYRMHWQFPDSPEKKR